MSNLKKYVLIIVFVLFSATFIIESGVCYSGKDLLSEPITLQVKNSPLSEVLKKIADSCGYDISIGDKWTQLPISISIVNTPVEQALKRILKNHNVVILTDNDKKQISLWLQGDMAAEIKTKKTCDPGLQESPVEFDKYIAQIGEANIELLPPTIANGKGITFSQFTEEQPYIKSIRNNEMGVLPPSASNKNGMNLEEFQRRQNRISLDQLNTKTTSGLPPGKSGEQAISLAELNALPAPPPPPNVPPK